MNHVATDVRDGGATPRRLVRGLVLGLLGAGLLWAVGAHSLVAALAERNPVLALSLRSSDPLALLELAKRREQENAIGAERGADQWAVSISGDGLGVGDPAVPSYRALTQPDSDEHLRSQKMDERRALVEAVVAQEPANARALAMLGEIARESGREGAGAVLLAASARQSLRLIAPHRWLLERAVEAQDWASAMDRVDLLMRMHPQAVEVLAPLVAQLAEKPEAIRVIAAALAGAPPWRSRLLAALTSSVSDARTPLHLLLALKSSPNPPTHYELERYLSFLLSRGFYDLAHYAWLQFLPDDQLASVGTLFNGSFELRPSGLPFDWILPSRGTATVEIARRPDAPSQSALVIDLGHGRVELGGVRQLVRLAPGHYRVGGEVRGELGAVRGLKWRVACRGQQTPLGESSMFRGRYPTWQSFSFVITVPMVECPLQFLQLVLDARMHSERLASGLIWFDTLTIEREDDARILAGHSPPREPQ